MTRPNGNIRVQIAKCLMKIFERYPTSPERSVGALNQVFRHSVFLDGSELDRKRIMLESSQHKYDSEIQYPWDRYFGMDLLPLLEGKVALDLGCFTGGRTVAWAQRYELAKVYGIDIEEVYTEAATRFGEIKGVHGEFRLSMGESLPFEDQMFDAVLSFDVFEHVTDVEKTLNECYRVLKKQGRLFVVFPSYFHPLGNHLSLVTMTPFIHYFFKGDTLIRAYNGIIEERGDTAYWYKRDNPCLENWERCNTINGTTAAKFRFLIKAGKWKIVHRGRLPILAVGITTSKKPILRFLGSLMAPIAAIPVLEEFLACRIVYILEKY